MSLSSLISAFPPLLHLELHHSVVSTHPQSNKVAPLVHSRASPPCSAHQSTVLCFTPQQSGRRRHVGALIHRNPSLCPWPNDTTIAPAPNQASLARSCFNGIMPHRRNQSGEEKQWRFDKRFGFFKPFQKSFEMSRFRKSICGSCCLYTFSINHYRTHTTSKSILG